MDEDSDIRAARADDAAAIAAIYAQGIEGREATFETEEPRDDHFLEAITASDGTPFLVASNDDAVLGWARLSPFSDRAYYAGVAEASVYVERGARGTGVGRRLLDALVERAGTSGYWKIVGLVFPSNHASVRLFGGSGFRAVGLLERHGRLDGDWRDVLLLERALSPRDGATPRPQASPGSVSRSRGS